MEEKGKKRKLALVMAVVMALQAVTVGGEAVTEQDDLFIEEILVSDEAANEKVFDTETDSQKEAAAEDPASVRKDTETEVMTEGAVSLIEADEEYAVLAGTISIEQASSAGIRVALYQTDDTEVKESNVTEVYAEGLTDKDGRYEIEQLEPGNYRVEYSYPDPGFDGSEYVVSGESDLGAVDQSEIKLLQQTDDEDYFAWVQTVIFAPDTQLDLTLLQIEEEVSPALAGEEAAGDSEESAIPSSDMDVDVPNVETQETMEAVETDISEDQSEALTANGQSADHSNPDGTAEDEGMTAETEWEMALASQFINISDDDEADAGQPDKLQEDRDDTTNPGAEDALEEDEAEDAASRLAAAAQNWGFDVYYINEIDQHAVKKTGDFNLKYQMEFHTSETLPAGAVMITIPARLFYGRAGSDREEVLPDDIGLPEVNVSDLDLTLPEREIVSMLISERRYKSNGRSSFNYYTNASGDLVFFNYGILTAGTNATWQVLYKRLRLINIVDGTSWNLSASASVVPIDGEAEQTQQAKALTGTVDSRVMLESLVKEPLDLTGLNYTPGLYTQSQVNAYVDWYTSNAWSNRINTGSGFDNYKYVVWDIHVKGSGSQYWNLYVKDTPSYVTGTTQRSGSGIVGFGQGTVSSAYQVRLEKPVRTAVSGQSGTFYRIKAGCSEETWGVHFYVVTAYPASMSAGDTAKNDITVLLEPYDGIDENQTAEDQASWSYADYYWSYRGYIIGIDKWNKDFLGSAEQHQKTYPGWLEKYEAAKSQGQDAGGLPYRTWGRCYGYVYTHAVDSTDSASLGSYIEGSSYEVTVVDDVEYAYADGQEIMLDDQDYYFDSVSISRVDYGYDIWEDTTAEAEHPEGVDQAMTVYAMFCGSTAWEAIGTSEYTDDGKADYQFTAEQISRQPYRVKVKYRAVSYVTHCYIDVSVCLRQSSPALTALLYNADGTRNKVSSLQLENLSGIAGQTYGVPGRQDGDYFQDTSTTGSDGQGGTNYSETGLADFTQELYGTILMRDNAFKTLDDLHEQAAAFKSVSLENDPDNNRVLLQYCLTAYSGYEVYSSELVAYLKQMGVPEPGIKEVVWYDLLPTGVHFDASAQITAGRITNMDSYDRYKSEPGFWDTSQMSVSVDPAADVITNWRSTGRTLVAFHLRYEGADPAAVMGQLWAQGWGVSFGAYYSWDELEVNRNESNTNIAALMPDGTLAADQRMLGRSTEVYPDDGSVPANGGYEFFSGGDINDDQVTDVRNVLYAHTWAEEDMALSSEDRIEKTVRADADVSAPYGISTSVVPEGTYTYNITVTSATGMKDLVVFDRLEHAVSDRDMIPNENMEMDDEWWQGTFLSVDVSEARLLGIEPVIYYHADSEAALPQANVSLLKNDVDEVLSTGGWIKAEHWELAGYTVSDVRAVAVDLRKTLEQTDYTLVAGASVNVKIRMQAPSSAQAVWSYNNPSYFSTRCDSTGQELNTAFVVGNSVRVCLADNGILEIAKTLADGAAIPISQQKEAFTFTVKRHGIAYANQLYTLQTLDGEMVDHQMHATDYAGQLQLYAGQKAVFTDIPIASLSDYEIEEQESVFWRCEVSQTQTAGMCSVTFANVFKPVVYFQKIISGVPGDENAQQTAAEAVFTFKLQDGSGEGIGNSEFWYVKEVREDGVSPEKDTNLGEKGLGRTAEDGTFTLHAGEIIALFPGEIGDSYTITEITEDGQIVNDGSGDNWVVKTSSFSGVLTEAAQAAVVKNYYRWKDLALTKTITHRDAEEVQHEGTTFSFRITDSEGQPAAGRRWTLEQGSDAQVFSGVTDDDGQFSAPVGGRTVVIHGLEAEMTYTITEIDCPENYEPVNDGSLTVKMPLYASAKKGELINDWVRRPLKIRKTVAVTEDQQTVQTQWFAFAVNIDDQPYANQAYTLEKNGRVYEEEGRETVTDAEGRLMLKSGETAVFKDAGVNGSTVYEVIELHTEDERYRQIYPKNNEAAIGVITGEDTTVQFINGEEGILILGKRFVVGEGDNPVSSALLMSEELPEISCSLAYKTVRSEGNDWQEISSDILVQFDVVRISSDAVSVILDEDEKKKLLVDGLISFSNEELLMISGSWTDESGQVISVSDMQFRVTEQETDQDRILYYCADSDLGDAAGYVRMQVSDPANGSIVIEDMASESAAVITNQLTDLKENTVVHKQVIGLNNPNEGEILTFTLERFDGLGWEPAEGIDYYLRNAVTNKTGGMQTTGDDGHVYMQMIDGEIPELVFPNQTVYIQPSDVTSGTLRLNETANQESSWGELRGYADNDGEASLAVQNADTFVNDNRSAQIEIRKVLSGTQTDRLFTFRLEQVLSLSRDTEVSELTLADILASQAVGGLNYEVYGNDDDLLRRTGTVEEDGTLTLAGGEYALLTVGQNTLWKISEQSVPSGYRLEQVNGIGEKTTKVISVNTVLVKALGTPMAILHYQDDADTVCMIELGDLSALPDEVAVEKKGYVFENWYLDPDGRIPAEGAITEDTHVYGGWREADAVLDTAKINKEADHMIFASVSDYEEIADLYEGVTANTDGSGTITRYDVTEENGEITSYYLSNTVTYFPEGMQRAFAQTQAKTIIFVNVDSSRVTSMYRMFDDNSLLTSISFGGNWNAARVTNMNMLFRECTALESLVLPESMITEDLEECDFMFYHCAALKTLVLPEGFNTSKVQSMKYVFSQLKALTVLDLPESFSMANVTDMMYLFAGDSSLERLTLPESFQTGKVTRMWYTFAGLKALKNLYLPSGFDTSAITDMRAIFYNCPSLVTEMTLSTAEAKIDDALSGSFTESGASFILNYTAAAKELAEEVLATAPSGAKVVLGVQVD